MNAGNYAQKVANYLGFTKVGYQPETRWYTSGTKSWKTEKAFSGPLDRMRSGTQKVSAWEGLGAILTVRSTGAVMSGTNTPDPNQMTPYRTQRALKQNTQWQWGPAFGQMQSDMYYATVAAQANQPQQSFLNRLRKVVNS